MKILEGLLILSIFLLGFFSASIIGLVDYYDLEVPVLKNFSFFGDDNKAPSDFISENQIKIYDDKVVIYVSGASLSRYAPTGSMIPVLDQGSNGIRVRVNSPEDIEVGDIITFRQRDILIVHRVIEKGVDSNGIYFITKGDNNNVDDGKVRFSQVEYKTIGVIW